MVPVLFSAWLHFLSDLCVFCVLGLSEADMAHRLISRGKFTSFGVMANTVFVVSPASDCLLSLPGFSPDSGISFLKFQCFSEMRIDSQAQPGCPVMTG
jgi:hypothetical protein